ncbi:hypothetical protein M0805_000465 [Coniferiporia weirii]|nr:hypothetical protein M0805_000465 [Coniferiporia weirii]
MMILIQMLALVRRPNIGPLLRYSSLGKLAQEEKKIFYMDYLHSKYVFTNKIFIPSQVEPSVLQDYVVERIGPTLDKCLRLDWGTSMKSSDWNWDVIVLLAKDFIHEIKEGEWPAIRIDKSFTTTFIAGIITTKLKHIHEVVVKAHSALEDGTEDREKQQKALDRRIGWRNGMFQQQKRIIVENLLDNQAVWGPVNSILSDLGVIGMSDDETDTDVPTYRKSVQQRKLAWLNSDITNLFHAVESYKVSSVFLHRHGNRGLNRIHKSCNIC